jgi:hypothetical protein
MKEVRHSVAFRLVLTVVVLAWCASAQQADRSKLKPQPQDGHFSGSIRYLGKPAQVKSDNKGMIALAVPDKRWYLVVVSLGQSSLCEEAGGEIGFLEGWAREYLKVQRR